jgi:peroxiredoxin
MRAMASAPPLPATEAGDHAPVFALQAADGRRVHSHEDAMAAQPLLLAFLPVFAATDATLVALRDARAQLAAFKAHALIITANGASPDATFPVLADPGAQVARNYGVADVVGALVVIDHNRRVAEIIRDGTPQTRVAAALAMLDQLARERRTGGLGLHPPVLVMPRLLSRADCDLLIEAWHRPVKLWHSDGFTSAGFDTESNDFKVRIDSYGRTDQFVVRDPAINALLDAKLARRVLPEIAKAFRSQASRREDYRIACYDSAEAGALPAHRDNPTPQTHHRLFTVSVHLNAGDYEGGGLCFREFGDQVYEVERGTAVVWSCTLLHEVAAVTRGRRFILGTHLFNDEPRQGQPR